MATRMKRGRSSMSLLSLVNPAGQSVKELSLNGVSITNSFNHFVKHSRWSLLHSVNWPKTGS